MKKEIWKESFLRNAIKNSYSIAEVLRKLGLTHASGNYRTFKKRVEKFGIDISHFNPYKSALENRSYSKIKLKDILVENSTYNRGHLKKRLLKEGLKKNVCEICGFEGNWKGKPITMILDHINGVNNDNRLNNLRMVCPMCNSQLETHCGKNNRKEHNKCIDCGTTISRKSKRCWKCSGTYMGIKYRRVTRPTYDVLLKEVEETNYVKVGRKYGVSDNAIRKWIKFYENNYVRVDKME